MDPMAMLQVSMVEDDKPIELTNDEPVEMIEEPPTLEELASCIQFPLQTDSDIADCPSTVITEEEFSYYTTIFADINDVRERKLHCTACNVHMGTAPIAQDHRYEHPLLRVLLCEQCLKFYSSGDFQKDDDGSELYCRWCGQGGQVFCCAKCPFVFCKKCIQRNIGRAMVNHINNSDDWVCYACNPKDIWMLRALSWAVRVYSEMKMQSPPSMRTPEENIEIVTDYSICCKPTTKSTSKPEKPKTARTSSRALSPRTISPKLSISSRMSSSSKISIASVSPRAISPAMPVLERETYPIIVYPKIPDVPFRGDNISEWDVLPPTKCPKKPEKGLDLNMILVPIVKKLVVNPVTGKRSGVYRNKPSPPTLHRKKVPFRKRMESLLKPINITTDFEDLIDKSGNDVPCTTDIISIDDSPPPSPKPIQKKNQKFLQVKPASKLLDPVRKTKDTTIYKTIQYPPQEFNQQVTLQTIQNNPVVSDMIQNLQKQIKPGDPQKIIKIVSPDGRAFLIDPMKMPSHDQSPIPSHYMNQARPFKKQSQPPPLQVIQPQPTRPPLAVRKKNVEAGAPKWFDNSVSGLQKISQLISSIIVNIHNDQQLVVKSNRVFVYNSLQAHLKVLSDNVDKLKVEIRDEYLKSVSTVPANARRKQILPPKPQNGPSDFGNHFLTFQSEFQNKILEKELHNQPNLLPNVNPKPKLVQINNARSNKAAYADNLGLQITGVQSLMPDLPQISEVTTLNENAMNGSEDMNGMDDDDYIDPSFMLEANMEEGDNSVIGSENQGELKITSVRSECAVPEKSAPKKRTSNGVKSTQKEDSTEASKKRIKNLKKHLKDIQKEIADRRKEKPKNKANAKSVEGEDIFHMDVTCDSDNESISAEVDIPMDSDNDSVKSIPGRPVSVYEINSDSDSDCVVINDNDKDPCERSNSSASSRSKKKRKHSDSDSCDKVAKKSKATENNESEKVDGEPAKDDDVAGKELSEKLDSVEEKSTEKDDDMIIKETAVEKNDETVKDTEAEENNTAVKDSQDKETEENNSAIKNPEADAKETEENNSDDVENKFVDGVELNNLDKENKKEEIVQDTNDEDPLNITNEELKESVDKTLEADQSQEKPKSAEKLDNISTDDLVSIAKAIAESIIEANSGPKPTKSHKSKTQEDDLEQLLSSNVVFRKGENTSPDKQSDQAIGSSFGDAFSSFITGNQNDDSNNDDQGEDTAIDEEIVSRDRGSSSGNVESVSEVPGTEQENTVESDKGDDEQGRQPVNCIQDKEDVTFETKSKSDTDNLEDSIKGENCSQISNSSNAKIEIETNVVKTSKDTGVTDPTEAVTSLVPESNDLENQEK